MYIYVCACRYGHVSSIHTFGILSVHACRYEFRPCIHLEYRVCTSECAGTQSHINTYINTHIHTHKRKKLEKKLTETMLTNSRAPPSLSSEQHTRPEVQQPHPSLSKTFGLHTKSRVFVASFCLVWQRHLFSFFLSLCVLRFLVLVLFFDMYGGGSAPKS